jgi:(2R)-sulfolactate sulfo-lyase subunit beta
VRSKAANAKVVAEFDAMFQDYTDMIFKEKTSDLSESQPTKGNIRGGLTTIEEKALGNIEKLGRRTKFVGCLKPAEAPKGKGLWFMDTSSAAAEAVTLWAASGAVVHLFPTGQGNIIGNPIEPVIKISGNPLTCSTMSEHIDVDVSAMLRGEMNVDEAGDKLIEMIVRTANGRLTDAEALGHREFVMTKLYRSA